MYISEATVVVLATPGNNPELAQVVIAGSSQCSYVLSKTQFLVQDDPKVPDRSGEEKGREFSRKGLRVQLVACLIHVHTYAHECTDALVCIRVDIKSPACKYWTHRCTDQLTKQKSEPEECWLLTTNQMPSSVKSKSINAMFCTLSTVVYSSGSQTVSRGSLGSRGFLPGEPRTITIFYNFIFFHNFISVR